MHMTHIQKKLLNFSSLAKEKTLNIFRGCLQDKIFYLHIPKCGGTSINKAIQACYHKWTLGDTPNFFAIDHVASWETGEILNGNKLKPDVVDDQAVMNFREELLIYYMAQRHISYIGGHFKFSEKAYEVFGEEFSYITILRNPVKRWISSYLYNRYRNPQKYRRIDLSIEEYLESDFGKSQGYEYAKFLGGVDKGGDFMNREAVERAKNNLQKFCIVGFLEDMSDFETQFEKRFERRLNIGRLNSRPAKDNVSVEITESMMKKITQICEPDIDVYQYAVKRFASAKVRDLFLETRVISKV